MKPIICLFIITSVAASCCSKEPRSLSGCRWIAEKLEGGEVKLREGGEKLYIEFDEQAKRVTGKAGCNRFFSNYSLHERTLTFSDIGATKMTCPDIHIEMKLFKVLDHTDSFTIRRNKLSLKEDGNVIAVFKAECTREKTD